MIGKFTYDMRGFKDYMDDVRRQLFCNASEEYKKEYITYDISNEEVNDNRPYFAKCMKEGLSPYKALLFFNERKELT